MPAVPATLDWLFWMIGGLVAIGSLWMLIWALFRDRARGRYRCPRCWYELTATGGAAPALPVLCSECGRTTAKLRLLRKRRPRWRWALFALVLIPAAGTIAYYPSAMRNGWLSIVPNRVLIDIGPIVLSPRVMSAEITRRRGIMFGQASPGARFDETDLVRMVNRVARGIPLVRPISPQWQHTYGRLIELPMFEASGRRAWHLQWSGASLDPAVVAAMRELLDIPTIVEVRTRAEWPAHVPIFVHIKAQSWWPWPAKILVRVRDSASREMRDLGARRWFCLPPCGPGEQHVHLDVHPFMFCTTESGFLEEPRDAFQQDLNVRLVDSIDQILTPIVDPSIDALVKSMQGNAETGFNGLDVSATAIPAANGIAFGVIIEWSRDGRMYGTAKAWWMGGSPKQAGWQPLEAEFDGDLSADRRFRWGPELYTQHGQRWTVRIRSDPETALRVIDADRYWEGAVSVDITIP